MANFLLSKLTFKNLNMKHISHSIEYLECSFLSNGNKAKEIFNLYMSYFRICGIFYALVAWSLFLDIGIGLQRQQQSTSLYIFGYLCSFSTSTKKIVWEIVMRSASAGWIILYDFVLFWLLASKPGVISEFVFFWIFQRTLNTTYNLPFYIVMKSLVLVEAKGQKVVVWELMVRKLL